ncbi:MAG: trehalose-6-phosphate synthase [Candidatus Dormibacteraeota bacterium]|nr:trehalose-6-phosphate synthase [Candidatus Dormibacteraeota bacterium]
MLRHLHPIVAANRAPLALQPADPYRGTPERLVKGSGGLVTGLSTLAATTEAVWVAVARDEADRMLMERGDPAELVTEDGTAYRVAFVDPGREAYELYYSVISNPLLWFIQHYLWDLAREPVVDGSTQEAWTKGYLAVNELVAEQVVRQARASRQTPLVFVQDYQLYCVPAMVRNELRDVRIQHFVHVPWPTPQYWSILPRRMRDAIVDGMLGADVIGFQTSRDVRNFLMTCEDNLGLTVDMRERTVLYEGRAIWVRNYPISIDVNELTRLAERPEVLAEERSIAEWRPKHLILRVDRTDLSKNIVRGFLAYERMLEAHRELHGDVVFWAFLQPSRQDIDDYRAYLGNVLGVAARINRTYSRGGWTPIRVEVEENMERAAAAYKSFDVLLVNPIYDGMNLVAKEGPLINRTCGVLVLSENAGSHEELGRHAITVNPFDVDETAEALYLGLTMDQQQRQQRQEGIREIVRTNDISRWISLQLQDLRELIG